MKPPSQTPLKDVKEQIRQQLLQQKRQKAITDWVEGHERRVQGQDRLPGRLRAARHDRRPRTTDDPQ